MGRNRWWVSQHKTLATFNPAHVADEFSGLIIDKDKERNIRAAVWSPPGIGGGGALMAVMASTAQVSVFAPGQDPYSNEYVEVSPAVEGRQLTATDCRHHQYDDGPPPGL